MSTDEVMIYDICQICAGNESYCRGWWSGTDAEIIQGVYFFFVLKSLCLCWVASIHFSIYFLSWKLSFCSINEKMKERIFLYDSSFLIGGCMEVLQKSKQSFACLQPCTQSFACLQKSKQCYLSWFSILVVLSWYGQHYRQYYALRNFVSGLLILSCRRFDYQVLFISFCFLF